jgi:hypothetical protein
MLMNGQIEQTALSHIYFILSLFYNCMTADTVVHTSVKSNMFNFCSWDLKIKKKKSFFELLLLSTFFFLLLSSQRLEKLQNATNYDICIVFI